MHHHHQHAHPHHSLPLRPGDRPDGVFYWAIVLNLLYTAIETVFGIAGGSMGLLSDAGHNLGDVASLLIALIAYKASQHDTTPRFSYGYGRATVEASLINAVILYVAVILIAIESVKRLIGGGEVDGTEIAWVASAGVAVNGITAWMLMRHSKDDLNVKGAFMHMVADTLVSVGVVASGIVINFTGWEWVDPAAGLFVAILIAIGSWSLLRESLHLVLDAVPSGIDTGEIERTILSLEQVRSLHHLHVWALSTTANAMTVHVIVDDPTHIDNAIAAIRNAVVPLGIAHATIEAETTEHICSCSCSTHPGTSNHQASH